MTSPYLFQAKAVGASLVVNSLTKYIGGHGNALGGAVTEVGNYDWSAFPNIYAEYQGSETAKWGITQIKKKGLRDLGVVWVPRLPITSPWGQRHWLCECSSSDNAMAICRICEHTPRSNAFITWP